MMSLGIFRRLVSILRCSFFLIKQAMASFAEAHTQSMAAMTDQNSEALATAVEKITATLISPEGHISPEVPSPVSLPSPSAHTFLVADKGAASPPARAHTSQFASVDFCRAAPLRLRKQRGGGGGGGGGGWDTY